MSKILEEQMNSVRAGYGIKADDKGHYDPKGKFKDVLTVDSAIKVAKIYALEQQIRVMKNFKTYYVVHHGEDDWINSCIQELEEQLKSLKDE